jgi:hypothetical protein
MRVREIVVTAALAASGVIGVGAGVSAAPTRVGTETFSLTSDINAEGGTVTASGVINDTGQDIVISDTEDTFDFGANGQITVFHSPIRSRDHFNEKKCSFSFTEKGTYVFGNGTGEWADYNGSGRYTVTGRAVNACNGTPVGTLTIRASGPINHATDG